MTAPSPPESFEFGDSDGPMVMTGIGAAHFLTSERSTALPQRGRTLELDLLRDRTTSIMHLGPHTLVTVDEGYAAGTTDDAEQKIPVGGRAFMLTHQNGMLENSITERLRTFDMRPINVRGQRLAGGLRHRELVHRGGCP